MTEISVRESTIRTFNVFYKTESWNHQEERTNHLDNLNTYIKDNIKFIIDYNHNPGQSIEEKVRNLLVRMNSYFRGAYNPSALEKWWAVIYEYPRLNLFLKRKIYS